MSNPEYAALREYLDKPQLANWPCVSLSAYANGLETDETAAARAAWWTRLVAPRREAEADLAADTALEAVGRRCGWYLNQRDQRYSDRARNDPYRWLPREAIDVPTAALRVAIERDGLTTRQLRARLAFVGATGVACRNCAGTGESFYLRAGHYTAGFWTCPDCQGTGRILPEPVPQRDASHGARCGCEVACENCGGHAVPADVAAKRKVWPCSRCNGRGRHAQWECQWCGRPGVFGTGTVRDGRRDGQHDYDPGDRPPHWLYVPGADATTPEAAQRELAHRREQPDACGHPYWFPFPHSKNKCRAPLAETLHGERDAHDPETTTYRQRQSYYTSAGRREGP